MIGSLLGGLFQYDAAKKAARAQADALAEEKARLAGISIPEAKRLVVEELVSQGNLTPELMEAFELPPSEVAKIQEDQALRNNQVQALDLIKQRAQGGLTAADRADFNQIRNAVARDEQAKQAQLLQAMQARGMGGSGAEFAAALANSQNSAENASEQGDRLAAAASRQALEAAAQLASQSGQVRQQDLNAANIKASAQDEYNRFNVQNQQNVANQNVQNRNQAQQYNLGEKQRLSEQNIANRRAEELRYNDALQQHFQNQFSKATGLNAITGQQGQNQANKYAAQGAAIGGLGNALDQGIGAAFGVPMGGVAAQKKQPLQMSEGGQVPGVAYYEGDNPHNDTVDAKLSPGEVVLPRSVTESDNPAKEAAKFMKDLKKRASLDVNGFLTKLSLNRK